MKILCSALLALFDAWGFGHCFLLVRESDTGFISLGLLCLSLISLVLTALRVGEVVDILCQDNSEIRTLQQ